MSLPAPAERNHTLTMRSNLYALLFRMRYINRWSLMQCFRNENLTEHSLETALIAYALAVIENEKFGGSVNEERTALVAMLHDAPEILTGDLPTPVKHGSTTVESAYAGIETEAKHLLVEMSPDYMKSRIDGILNEEDEKITALVKAADKISAHLKCLDELKMGNPEFNDAAVSTYNVIEGLNCPAADEFLRVFTDGFNLTLDGLKNTYREKP